MRTAFPVEVTGSSSSRWHTGKRLFWYAWKIPSSCALQAELKSPASTCSDEIGIQVHVHTSAQAGALACSLRRRAGELKVIHIGAQRELTSKGFVYVCVFPKTDTPEQERLTTLLHAQGALILTSTAETLVARRSWANTSVQYQEMTTTKTPQQQQRTACNEGISRY